MTSLTDDLRHGSEGALPGRRLGDVEPIGITVIGGLSVSGIVTLVLIPLLYSLAHQQRERYRKDGVV